ncbi:hypothetical protein MLD38_020490 [Melastoma candidum]|uniref:Uncharacterized protein n=1 Tax=Melastoma candidum TaxID=119954 RepID=A0ACB9QD25_9MYRT|nr:hypothetical protein MLD38_020490 [Melastoma candidum]
MAAASSPSTPSSLLSLLIVFLSLARSQSLAGDLHSRPKPKAILLPVRKDSATLQYTTTIRQRTPLVPVKLTVDLGAKSPWVNCEGGYVSSTYKPVLCGSKFCELAVFNSCSSTCYQPRPEPGCNNNTCGQFESNSFIPTAYYGELSTDAAVLRSTDGKNPGRAVSVPGGIVFTCGFDPLTQQLAKNAKGMLGLGRSGISLPSVLSYAFGFPNKFGMCLSSSRSHGVIIFGDGPYFLQPGKEVSDYLIYTPLILNPVSTAVLSFLDEPSSDYFINVTGIKVNGQAVRLNPTLLKINNSGNGGTKLSTVNPYTVMETSIYKAVTKAFLAQVKYLKRVGSVQPFEYCFNTTGVGSTRVGPAVPQIELLLGKSSWIIFGANSMVYVGNGETFCLGIVDGGTDAKTSIVIGGHQLEDNLVQVDMVNKRLGFTSSLLFYQTTCANFNFTVAA